MARRPRLSQGRRLAKQFGDVEPELNHGMVQERHAPKDVAEIDPLTFYHRNRNNAALCELRTLFPQGEHRRSPSEFNKCVEVVHM
jgi:hypothetical protein